MRIWVVLSLFLIGCANSENKCGGKFLVLWPTSAGRYEMREVALDTLSSPYELNGAAANVYFENGIGGAGFDGPVASPRYTDSGDTCVPMDAESSMAVSVYAQFEQLYKFETKLGTEGLLSWPRNVGVDIHLIPPDGVIHNNAHYFSQGDSIAVLPYSLGGLPLGLNHGVIAHEHFHGHFQRSVMDPMNAVLANATLESLFYPSFAPVKPTEQIEEVDLNSARGLNNFVLRAWNEGLADLYGAIYTGDPNFFGESLPHLKVARSLEANVQLLGTRGDLQAAARAIESPTRLVGYSYSQGALLARVLYRLAYSGAEAPEVFLARILLRLSAVPTAVLPTYDSEVMNIDEIVPVLLEGFPLNAESCETLNKALTKEILLRSFSQCRAP